jgi:hydrogenase/urease accessory protein HupE
MLIYENERTGSIVSRLVSAGNTIRPVVIIISVAVIGALLAFLGYAYLRDAWVIFGVIGLVIGYFLGAYLASLFAIIFEWMAQILVAQGEILAELNRKA